MAELDPAAKPMAEAVAVEFLDSNPEAVTVCVLDATRIERGLNLVLEVLERGHPAVVALNMWDEAQEKGVEVDAETLSALLGVPVVPTVATEGVGVDDLRDEIAAARTTSTTTIRERLPTAPETVDDESVAPSTQDESAADDVLTPAARWDLVDAIVEETVTYRETEPTLSELLGRLAVAPKTGLPLAVAVLYGMWSFFSAVAGFFTDGYFVPLFDDVHDTTDDA